MRRCFWCLLLLCLPALASAATSVLGVYADNRKQGLPNHVTQDLLLVAYVDLLQQDREAREARLQALLKQWLNTPLTSKVPGDNALAQDVIGVARALMSDDATGLSERAAAEFEFVQQAGGIAPSPLFSIPVDASQYQPRGFYAEDLGRARFFRTVRYLGNNLFHLYASKATGVTPELLREELAAAQWLAGWSNMALYREMLLLLTAETGAIEDLTLLDVDSAVAEYDSDVELRFLRDALEVRVKRHPEVLQGLVDTSLLEEGVGPRKVLTGLRILPGLAAADTVALQRLVEDGLAWYGQAKADEGPEADEAAPELPFSASVTPGGVVKGYPMALDLLAALGSQQALAALEAGGNTAYAGYPEQLEYVASGFADSIKNGEALWALMAAIVSTRDGGQSAIDTAAAFWTLHRHGRVLYDKQSYTPVERSLALADRSASTLEPATEVYTLLLALADVHAGTTDSENSERWTAWRKLLKEAIRLSTRLDQGEPLTADDGLWLADIDLALKALNIDSDQPRVVDVHTNPNDGLVLQEATGCVALVEAGESRGARLSHHEFKQPLSERMTDAEWQAQLAASGCQLHKLAAAADAQQPDAVEE